MIPAMEHPKHVPEQDTGVDAVGKPVVVHIQMKFRAGVNGDIVFKRGERELLVISSPLLMLR